MNFFSKISKGPHYDLAHFSDFQPNPNFNPSWDTLYEPKEGDIVMFFNAKPYPHDFICTIIVLYVAMRKANILFVHMRFIIIHHFLFRMMQEHTNNDWRGFYPKTNVFWLHYLLDKLTSDVYYKNTKSKVHRNAFKKMQNLKDEFLEYSSAYEYIIS